MYLQPDSEMLRTRLEHLTALTRHPGWGAYQSMLNDTYLHTEQSLMQTVNPTEMARYIGSLKAVKDLQTWLDREIKSIQSYLSNTP